MAHSPEYTAFLNSPQWRDQRTRVLKRAGYRCEHCGISAAALHMCMQTLEVHHPYYNETLGTEPDKDLEALCPCCHKQADEERRLRVEEEREARYQDARLNGWATKVYGADWDIHPGVWQAEDAFEDWLRYQDAA